MTSSIASFLIPRIDINETQEAEEAKLLGYAFARTPAEAFKKVCYRIFNEEEMESGAGSSYVLLSESDHMDKFSEVMVSGRGVVVPVGDTAYAVYIPKKDVSDLTEADSAEVVEDTETVANIEDIES